MTGHDATTTTEKDAIETAFWATLGEQAEVGPSVDFDWLLGAVLSVIPPADPEAGRTGSGLRCTFCGMWGHLNTPCLAAGEGTVAADPEAGGDRD